VSLLAKTASDWAGMTADERRKFSAEQKAGAIEAVESKGFPTGLKVIVGGKEYIARPVRCTESGGVTYNLTPRQATVGKYSARFNKFSFTLMGEGSEVADSFESETIL